MDLDYGPSHFTDQVDRVNPNRLKAGDRVSSSKTGEDVYGTVVSVEPWPQNPSQTLVTFAWDDGKEANWLVNAKGERGKAALIHPGQRGFDNPLASPRLWEVGNLVSRMKAEILADIKAGAVPPSVSSFRELHDYVDANTYAGLCDEDAPQIHPDDESMWPADQEWMDKVNEATDQVDEWLKAWHPFDGWTIPCEDEKPTCRERNFVSFLDGLTASEMEEIYGDEVTAAFLDMQAAVERFS